MPKREDIRSVLLLGSGPIVIGQACEFDYSGTQAVRALREEGYRVILVNSNPATIMTDPDLADATYIEPLTPEWVERVIERERPDALLPTMGGQVGLNVSLELYDSGILEKYDVELIGADARAIRLAEDREEFAEAMRRIGLEVPHGGFAHSMEEALAVAEIAGFPAIVRPSFTLGGTGGGIAYNREEFETVARTGLDASPIGEILIDKSVIGWKEYELEVMRDHADNVVIVCSIENFDAMGVHTGDSITVAPAMTLSDREYQVLRDGAIACIREIGVAAGGCNIQFAVNPDSGEVLVIEMNPRVSRSSALASKATGFPIARIGTKLAVGYRLDELPNAITLKTPASFEPVLDYVVVKVPRFAFEKFPSADPTLSVQMKAVGEVMAIGRTFKEAWMKGFRALENGRDGWEIGDSLTDDGLEADDRETLLAALRRPTADRPFQLKRALRTGLSTEDLYEASRIDRWFLEQLRDLVEAEEHYASLDEATREATWEMKRLGYGDAHLGRLRGEGEAAVRRRRWEWGMHPSYKMVDTCAGEFPAATPYLYSTYEEENESAPSERRKVVVLGSGPNRIGQGVEFDYCCVSAAFALAEEGFETIMVNSNPETVSTDFDVSDKLYFEPLTLENVLEIVHLEGPEGVVVQMGGQTPLKLASALRDLGVAVLGTSVDAIDRAEDRERFEALARQLDIAQPANGLATSEAQAIEVAGRIGYPVLVRPSYVLGGRAMEIVYDEESLKGYFARAVRASPEHPVLIDRFLEDAFEADVDAVCDGDEVLVGGVMQHIEDAGIHSGDSACVVPPYLLRDEHVDQMKAHTRALARELGVVGLINVQFAVKDGIVYVLEVNPRASRTVPFLSKATGVPLARLAARLMAGRKLSEFELRPNGEVQGVAVKESVFPFDKLAGVDALLGPEMRSTGEVMGIADSFGLAIAKAQVAAGNPLPMSGRVVVTVHDQDKANVTPIARRFHELGFEVWATSGTAKYLRGRGVPAQSVLKVHEGRPNIVDHLISGEIDLLINTPLGKHAQFDDYAIRRAAIQHRVPYTTTLSGASALCDAVIGLRHRKLQVMSLQDRAQRAAVSV
ncbi:MAG: carbamoyl-phosphate synthase large subunit [Gemmatimonadetes bacterium]|uniref:Carbamoyl phosphate synthase large chain n=1 Tax=Candidatus Kutchimonas denitrificans TaxID=3056748 RepID=A0AAE4ZBR1_9BACT|nr:carbamoyl-phosphate synthase large subunit [Gemmatimonadota bacterium]NIR76287.1 carbamoyl-phosphate synthase large subunit [Candidatus Kutchimonas denitrificans]NIS02310.1 carbamoyl-phosphate synthase large subunit [Gemmatimonadota bacterium]NIT68129.1 carbamoyl-phosphate synthase large subunit [Gemmatimonadota bacterium]NIU54353.1 carbamoyl-phosphate synthase large subunit [Gemmatimonadota bacterium]